MTEQRKRWEHWLLNPYGFDELIAFISAGSGGLSTYAKREGIANMTLADWVDADESRSVMYGRAREVGADALVDDAIAAAEDKDRDPQCRRVEMDAKKWKASKLRPKVYGDTTKIEHSGTMTLEQNLLALAAKPADP